MTAHERRQAAQEHGERMLRLIDHGSAPNPLEATAQQLIMLADIANSLGAIAEKLDTGPIWIRSGDAI